MAALPIHSRTGLRAVYVSTRTGRVYWPVLGGSEPPEPPPVPAPPAPPGPENGFPSGTPLEQMTAEQQVAYWKFYARKHEDTVKGMGDYQSLKDRAAQYDALLAASQTDQERAVEAAKAEGRNAAKAEATPQLVRTEIKAQAALSGMTDAAKLTEIVSRLDTSTFLNDKGEIDPAEIEKYVKEIVTPSEQQPVPLGQGRHRTDVTPSVASGREMFEASRKKRSA